jgi:hypothetical protein
MPSAFLAPKCAGYPRLPGAKTEPSDASTEEKRVVIKRKRARKASPRPPVHNLQHVPRAVFHLIPIIEAKA